MPMHGSRQQHKDDQAGIQMLMAAEREAQQIVNNARNSRASRLGQAKDESERELSQYRASRETEFRRKLSQATGDMGQFNKRLELETVARLQKLQAVAKQGTAKATDFLLSWVTTCKNEIIPGEKETPRKPDARVDRRGDGKIDKNVLNLL